MKFSLKFRLWHWLNTLVIFGLLGTVFLRKTFLSWRDNSEILMSKLPLLCYLSIYGSKWLSNLLLPRTTYK